MKKTFKSILYYVVMLFITAGLLWIAFDNLQPGQGERKLDLLKNTWAEADKYSLLGVSMLFIVSYGIRAYRWKMILMSAKYTIKTKHGFISLAIGYLVNMVIPRGGEVTRCYSLFKLDKTPVEVGLGSVVAERIVDVLSLFIIGIFAFVLTWNNTMWNILSQTYQEGKNLYLWMSGVGLIVASLSIIGYYFFHQNKKIKKIIAGFKKGLIAIFYLKDPTLFTILSILMWGTYLMTTFYTLEAFPQTSGLGLKASLVLLVISSIAIALPLPGGTGAYHTLVSWALITLYHIPISKATANVFIFHAWQTIVTIGIGIVSLPIALYLSREKN